MPVGQGYVGHARPGPDHAERFVADPFSGEPGARLYKSGDLGRWLPDGTIEYLGRIDRQLKIRGHRIEPAEIEVELMRNPDVAEAIVESIGGSIGGSDRPPELVGFVRPAPGALDPPDSRRLRAQVTTRLPSYLVPARIVIVEHFARLPSGKLDRAALAALVAADRAERTEPGAEAPGTATEIAIAAIWQQVLGIATPIGRQADFFECGGHSLSAMRVCARIAAALRVELQVAQLFDEPRLSALAARVDRLIAARDASADRVTFEFDFPEPDETG